MNRLTALICALFALIVSCGRKEPPRLAVYEKPPSPQALHIIHREDKMQILWSYQQGLSDAFIIYRAEGTKEFRKIARTKQPYYDDTDFIIGRTYTYRVFAQNAKGILSEPAEIRANPLDTPLPPSNITFSIGNNYIALSWEKGQEGVFFNVYRSAESSKYPLTPVNEKPLKEPFFKDTINEYADTYYTIRSLQATEIRDESAASKEIVISPADYIPSAPNGLKATEAENAIVLTWKENPEVWVKGYRVYRALNDEFILIGETQTPAFTAKGPVLRARYRITALGPVAEGPHSAELTAP